MHQWCLISTAIATAEIGKLTVDLSTRDVSLFTRQAIDFGPYVRIPDEYITTFFMTWFHVFVLSARGDSWSLVSLNEAFEKNDVYNGGFQKGSRTTDNIFILNGLVQRQLSIGSSLYLCYVDFSKAFDMINRHILFYKIMNSGWYGNVIDTMRNLYEKMYFRIKCRGKLSPSVLDTLGVNQGGLASGLLFRKYMADMSEYLETGFAVCVNDIIVAHMLWADDLILVSNTSSGLQKQLNGLHKFCSRNMMVVNELKTKVMVFGKKDSKAIVFNGMVIQNAEVYKYLGNIISPTTTCSGDILKENSRFLCDKARKAIFGIFKRLRKIGALPPKLMLYIFDTLIKPILLYGSDVWGVSPSANSDIDKVFLWFLKCILKVKSSTSNDITLGEVGAIPPSVQSHINVLTFYRRVAGMPENTIVKQVFMALYNLHNQGFRTWVSKVKDIAEKYNFDIDEPTVVISDVKYKLNNFFVEHWWSRIQNLSRFPKLELYKNIKNGFHFETYLDLVKDSRYRNAITKIRSSSHPLEIERGRYTKPQTPRSNRLCSRCKVIEDERHFILDCTLYKEERHIFLCKVSNKIPMFPALTTEEKFVYLLASKDAQILTWLGKFLYHIFDKRNKYLS